MFNQHVERLAKCDTVEYRRERKYRIANPTCRLLHRELRQHPAGFREIFTGRIVNSLYLDTSDFAFYRANVHGNANRMKIRLRWYGGSLEDVTSPQLEFKVRRGQAMCKLVYQLPDLDLNGLRIKSIHSLLSELELDAPLLAALKMLKLAIVVRYYRRYFLSADGTVRATTDEAVTYRRTSPNHLAMMTPFTDHSNQILELKYGVDDELMGCQVAAGFSFRMTRNSKYVNGLEALPR